jgi:hypothetical protein
LPHFPSPLQQVTYTNPEKKNNLIFIAMTTEWKDLCYTAKQQLQATRLPTSHPGRSFITLLHEPSFDNHSFLQITWKNNSLTWHLSIWDQIADGAKFTPINNLAYIGREIVPTIIQTSGTRDMQSIQAITSAIANLSIPPRIIPLNQFTMDGSYYTLTIAVDDTSTTFNWHTSPEEWQGLVDMADQLLRLQEELI